MTSGIISAKDRAVTAGSRTSEGSFINALQTDAAINPGNSGGPLVDKSGAVIFISHSDAQIERACNRVVVLNKNKVAFDGSVKKGMDFYSALK